MRKWLCVVLFVTVGFATAQVDDVWGTDYEDTWWSDEAPAEQLGLVEDETKEASDSFEPSKELTDDAGINDAVKDNFERDIVDEIKDLTAEENAVNKADDGNDDDYENHEIVGQEQKASQEDESALEDNADYQNMLDEINEDFKQKDEPESEIVDNLEDYQIEDNRSNEDNVQLEESDLIGKSKDDTDEPETNIDTGHVSNTEEIIDDSKNILAELNDASEEHFSIDYKRSDKTQENVVNSENTQENLNAYSTENQKVEDNIQNQQKIENRKSVEDEDNNRQQSTDIKKIETSDEDDMFKIDEAGKNSAIKSVQYVESQENSSQDINNASAGDRAEVIKKDMNSDEDTVDKVYEDLNADIVKLFQTWDKLTDETVENDDNVQEYEDKNGKPFREDLVLVQREEFENYDDGEEAEYDNANIEIGKESSQVEKETPIEYQKDAFVYEDKVNNVKDQEENIKEMNNDELSTTILESDTPVVHKILQVDDLTPKQYHDLMDQFTTLHRDELDTQSDDFGQNVAPVHVTINAEEATVITSPNYPNSYPSNNVVDWILEGEGTGIELNITDFEVRGVNGDFLLIKPGGLDDSGTEGLVFSYHLQEPRRYRFTDVSRMFMRFNTGSGLGFLRGFNMTVKMIWPPENEDLEPIPEPEALLPTPPANLTVSLGGMTVKDFLEIQGEFRRLIADMATMYINAAGIDMGLNTTQETAQVTRVSACYIHWPDFDSCVEVTFGVPLVYEDAGAPPRLDRNDLVRMWEKYVEVDPFATRLRSLGIQVFPVPNDGRVLLGWLVLAAGVVISALMLAFAMWRFTCFQDYSRMKNYSDSDSLRDEKRNLDLYPTPHQTLPPLYSEDYKWADGKYENSAKVDVGGYSNRSYIRDELLDIDSDDDVITPRDRFTTDV